MNRYERKVAQGGQAPTKCDELKYASIGGLNGVQQINNRLYYMPSVDEIITIHQYINNEIGFGQNRRIRHRWPFDTVGIDQYYK
ncbi:hypothetical protein BLOT_008851 [Blomia tropicalis]|nr:hypothetical protein BLOT_008851 [Blomia tropicalis]